MLFIQVIFIIPKNHIIMKAIAQIEKLNSDRCKHIIVRNLSRIMDIKILDIDLEKKDLIVCI